MRILPIPALLLLLALAGCGVVQPAQGPPTYNRQLGGHSGGA